MSLVEKALQKLQADKRAAASHPLPENVGRLVEQAPRNTAPVAPIQSYVKTSTRLIQVDRRALQDCGLLPPEHQERELSDQYRALKRPLIRSAFQPAAAGANSQQAVILTSALPGDGKTFTCINLSLSMSLERDHDVVLVDADVAKPHISGLFGVADEPGLLDVLADPNREIESVIIATDVPGLSIVPAGRRSSTATELLASDRMKKVVERLVALHPRGIVVFDSPPVLLTSEARALSAFMGQIVLVVKADTTPQQAVKDTIAILGNKIPINLILNQAHISSDTGYHYGYGFGYSTKQSGAASAGLNEQQRGKGGSQKQ